jgi:hypothetical protein
MHATIATRFAGDNGRSPLPNDWLYELAFRTNSSIALTAALLALGFEVPRLYQMKRRACSTGSLQPAADGAQLL